MFTVSGCALEGALIHVLPTFHTLWSTLASRRFGCLLLAPPTTRAPNLPLRPARIIALVGLACFCSQCVGVRASSVQCGRVNTITTAVPCYGPAQHKVSSKPTFCDGPRSLGSMCIGPPCEAHLGSDQESEDREGLSRSHGPLQGSPCHASWYTWERRRHIERPHGTSSFIGSNNAHNEMVP